MANPSTDGPTSANGTEILRRKYIAGHTTSGGTAVLIDGTAGYIYTVLSIIISEQEGSASGKVNLWVLGDDSTNVGIILDQDLNSKSTFVFSDRFVIAGEDELQASITATDNVDFLVSYIEQRWV